MSQQTTYQSKRPRPSGKRRCKRPLRQLLWAASAGMLLCCVVIVSGARSTHRVIRKDAVKVAPPAPQPPQQSNRRPIEQALRSRLSLQPEAFKLIRRLGQRFHSASRAQSTLVGTLTIGPKQQHARIVRRYDGDGEAVEIALGNDPLALTWNHADGARSSGSPATGDDRSLIERLVFDSPDHFVLAQLTGSSYQTIARGARPAGIGGADDYTGPIWDIVRVDEPPSETFNERRSQWRIYYINSVTELLEKIVSEEQGQQIMAEIAGWSNDGGEKVPSHIIWKRQGQPSWSFVSRM